VVQKSRYHYEVVGRRCHGDVCSGSRFSIADFRNEVSWLYVELQRPNPVCISSQNPNALTCKQMAFQERLKNITLLKTNYSWPEVGKSDDIKSVNNIFGSPVSVDFELTVKKINILFCMS
jgi:hypothetical protein